MSSTPENAEAQKAQTVEAAAGDVKARVLKQVEFYFGDANLPRDRFLLGLTKKTEEGWVPVETLMNFKRMRELSTDKELVVAALRSSADLLAVSEDGTLVRRKTPLVKAVNEEHQIYAKGLPLDVTLDALTTFFAKHGKVLQVRMRRQRNREFKGSVFVEYESKEKALELVEQGLTYDATGEKLLVEHRPVYIARKKKEYEERKAATEQKESGAEGEGEQAARGTKRKADEQPAVAAAEGDEKEFTRNLLVKMTGLAAEASRESIKAAVEGAGLKVAYTDFSRGQTEAVVRLAEDGGDAAAAAKKLAEDGVQIDGTAPTYSAIAGEDEDAYFAKVREFKRRRKSNNGGGRGRRQGNKNRR